MRGLKQHCGTCYNRNPYRLGLEVFSSFVEFRDIAIPAPMWNLLHLNYLILSIICTTSVLYNILYNILLQLLKVLK